MHAIMPAISARRKRSHTHFHHIQEFGKCAVNLVFSGQAGVLQVTSCDFRTNALAKGTLQRRPHKPRSLGRMLSHLGRAQVGRDHLF